MTHLSVNVHAHPVSGLKHISEDPRTNLFGSCLRSSQQIGCDPVYEQLVLIQMCVGTSWLRASAFGWDLPCPRLWQEVKVMVRHYPPVLQQFGERRFVGSLGSKGQAAYVGPSIQAEIVLFH